MGCEPTQRIDYGPSRSGERDVLQQFRSRALTHGVNPVLYWAARAVLLPFFLLYFRLRREGTEHVPPTGPLLLAANHRSFLDPFVIGALTRRPVYYVAKRGCSVRSGPFRSIAVRATPRRWQRRGRFWVAATAS
jgi:1-acyl-sn-glycerol-3-phosphate acyltransferase